MTKPIIGYAGLTHLGLCSCAAAASKEFDVIAYDQDKNLIAALKSAALPIAEPGLDQLIADGEERIAFVDDGKRLSACDVVYVSVDVPTDDSGSSNLAPVDHIIDHIGPHMSPTAILVILSQVPPGYSRGRALSDARLYYQVETLIFGRACERATMPERFIVGCAEPAQPLPEGYRVFLESFACPILPMRYESAELAKIAINCFLAASISTTNTLAELCEQLGADWSEIAPSLRLDARIGPEAYLKPGLGIGGGNIGRDLATICRLADQLGTDSGIIESYQLGSEHAMNWADRALRRLLPGLGETPRIAVLGLTYKENTHSVKNSPALALLRRFAGHKVQVYDPMAPDGSVGAAVVREESAMAAVQGADVVVIMTPWPEFRELDAATLASEMAGRVVIDPYGILDGAVMAAAGLEHLAVGKPSA